MAYCDCECDWDWDWEWNWYWYWKIERSSHTHTHTHIHTHAYLGICMPKRRRIFDGIVALLLTPDNVEPTWSSVAYRIAWQVQFGLQLQQQQQQRLDRLTVNFRRLLPLANLKHFLHSESCAKNICGIGYGSCQRESPSQAEPELLPKCLASGYVWDC